jgi:hypothetical protein
MAELAQVQEWMQSRILAGGAADDFAEAIVAGSEALTAAARIGIYANGYRARLRDCLRTEYPVLRRFAGDTVFDLFALDYIAAHPSTEASLYGFGAGFAAHLAERQPPDAHAPGSPLAIPAQLARLERARGEVQRAAGVERLAAPVVGGALLAPGLRLRLPDSVRLMRLDFDLTALVAAVDRDEEVVTPEARETFTAVARSRYRVGVHALDPWRFAWLEALGRDGAEIHAAAASATLTTGCDAGRALAHLALWLPAAAAAGLVEPA